MRDWYHKIHALCQAQLISFVDAEDAVQETFVRAFRRIDTLRDEAAMGSWLRQIARHVCVDIIRRQSTRPTVSGVENVTMTPEPDSVPLMDEREHLVRLVHQLPEPNREIVLLHYYQEMTYDEMAAWLNIARSTVNERLRTARQLLKHQLLKGRTS